MQRNDKEKPEEYQYEKWEHNPFERKRQLKYRDENFEIPPVENVFSDSIWEDEQLQTMKSSLNNVKSQINHLNPKKWHYLTRNVCLCGDVKYIVRKNFNAESATRAWVKMYEILSVYDVCDLDLSNKPSLSTLHLCEVPGAFVAAINHFMATKYPTKKWNWLATSLNPYYEGNDVHLMINEDNLMKCTRSHWTFLEDNTGNIINVANINSLVGEVREKCSAIHLVTADGSIDCQNNPAEQEQTVSILHFAEIITALCVLDKGGNFVVKIFTIFECQTVCNLYLLLCTFKEVTMFKPATSGDGNSEIYLICKEYSGNEVFKSELEKIKSFVGNETIYSTMALFERSDIPQKVMDRIYEAANFFTCEQTSVIEQNLQLFHCQYNTTQLFIASKAATSEKWVKMTKIEKIANKRKIIPTSHKNSSKGIVVRPTKDNTRSYHQKQLDMKETDVKRLLNILLKDIERVSSHEYIWDSFVIDITGSEDIVQKRKEKVFKNINNSQFCIGDLIIIRNEIRSKMMLPSFSTVIKDEWIKKGHNNCTRENVNQLIKESLKDYFPSKCNLDTDILCFHETLHDVISQSDVKKIAESLKLLIDTLCILPQSKSLFLCEFPLLTRLQVGYIVILSSFFQQAKLCVNQYLGLSGVLFVNFQRHKHKNCTHKLETLQQITTDLVNRDYSTLSLTSLTVLNDDQFDKIVRYNSTDVYHSLLSMVKKAKKCNNLV